MKFYLRNFGCKANRYDAEVISQALVKEGHSRVSDPSSADIQVVNTCAVTGRAEAKAVRFIRRVGRQSGGGRIVVVGCAVERDPERFRELPGVGLSLGTREKYNLHRILRREGDLDIPSIRRGEVKRSGMSFERAGIHYFEGRRRAFLKIQDGCDYRCSYCIIPEVRGKSVSRSVGEIVKEARALIGAGYREIALTGIHIGLYGRDLSPRLSLTNLLDELISKTDLARFRLSSIDAHEIPDGLIRLLADSNRVCKHLHIPLQSGSPSVLKRMRRRSSVERFREVCGKAVDAVPSIGLGTDVIVGFPGESETDFDRTREVIADFPFSYVHVFPFSSRPGTSAHRMRSEKVDGTEIWRRAMELRKFAALNGRKFRTDQFGKGEEVIVERNRGTWWEGRCSNYLKAYFPGNEVAVGDVVPVVIGGSWRDGVKASLVR